MESKIGEVTHFYPKPSAAVLKLVAPIQVGDEIHILGHTTDISQPVTSLQINHVEVDRAKPGEDVAVLVDDAVREGDEVFKIEG